MNDLTLANIELEEVAPGLSGGAPLVERNLSMLGHVKVRVDVHLGGAEISVKKLFSLSNGDAIELDAELDAPVSLMLEGKPIARGLLMAAGDCFGVKITEIL